MRIAMLAPPWIPVPPTGYGGIEWVVSLLTEELVARGHEVTLFASGDSLTSATLVSALPSAHPDRLHDPSIDLHHAGVAWRAVRDAAAAGRPFDIVHDHTMWTGPAFAGLSPSPVVVTHHSAVDADRRRLHSAFLGDAHHVCISRHQRSTWPELPVVAVVPNAIDVGSYEWSADKEPFVLSVSRIHPDKGNHTAIDVAERLGLPVVLAGKIDPGVGERYFAEEIAPRLHGERTVYLGEVSEAEKRTLMRRATCTLFPIRWAEPFGLVMIESMAAGTPCVAFAEGAAAEVIEHGVTGYVVRDLDEMVDAVRRVDQIDPKACRTQAEERFNPGVMADGYLAVYESVLDRAP